MLSRTNAHLAAQRRILKLRRNDTSEQEDTSPLLSAFLEVQCVERVKHER